ncbi:MAG: SUMF1/EgtB/PvdO family nonheme iron enzyme [Bacteroidetes bacterium]|nr:SUMF1/EgtB/PvdO family nonheme iron enzyme [Bacteroidota bacterium]
MKNKCTIWISQLLLMGLFYLDPFCFQIIEAQNSKDHVANLVEMVFVKGGTFQMGCNDETEERPVHFVTVDDFYIGKFEITFKQFKDFIDATAYTAATDSWISNYSELVEKKGVNWQYGPYGYLLTKSDYNDPVINISEKDAEQYCKWLSSKTGKSYRLPTEAEWEYAARGGNRSKGYKYSGSNNINEVAWYKDNSIFPHPVGEKLPNELGIYDMSGNVQEWCRDGYNGKYFAVSPTYNPQGDDESLECVVRGGSWFEEEALLKVTNRYGDRPEGSGCVRGFRIVCSETVPMESFYISSCSCSQQYKSEKKCENAVDGNVETEWIAGGFAPQWIKLTLNGSHSISKISWVNNMSPEGQVSMDFSFYDEYGNLVSTKTETYYAKNGQTNSATFSDLNNIRQIKVTVTKSPSWVSFKEIYVF